MDGFFSVMFMLNHVSALKLLLIEQ